jgi:hypothetical protein
LRDVPSLHAKGAVTSLAESAFLKASGVDFLNVVIDRKDVEQLNVEPTLKILAQLLYDRSTIVGFRGRLEIAFAGYDDDSRELHEIEEVRRFLARLDKIFPFWFYFLSLLNDTLLVILLSLCQYSKTPDGLFAVDPNDRARFLVEHYAAVNSLFERYGLDERENEALTTQITNYMEQRKNPPPIH